MRIVRCMWFANGCATNPLAKRYEQEENLVAPQNEHKFRWWQLKQKKKTTTISEPNWQRRLRQRRKQRRKLFHQSQIVRLLSHHNTLGNEKKAHTHSPSSPTVWLTDWLLFSFENNIYRFVFICAGCSAASRGWCRVSALCFTSIVLFTRISPERDWMAERHRVRPKQTQFTAHNVLLFDGCVHKSTHTHTLATSRMEY